MSDSSRLLGEIAARFERARLRDELIERWDGAGVGFASLARVVGFAVVWLLVLGLVIPTPATTPDELPVNAGETNDTVRSVTLDRRDERGFLQVARTDRVRIAWVGGSTLQQVGGEDVQFIPGFLPERVALDDGRRFDVDVYFLEAARVVDLYVAVVEALATEPDVIVVALNPALVYNGAAVQTWDNLDGLLAAGSWRHPTQLPLAAALVSPADVAWGTVGRGFEILEDRWYLGSRFAAQSTAGDLLRSAPPGDASDRDVLDRIAASPLPLDFWLADGDFSGSATRIERQLELFQVAEDFDDRINQLTLEQLAAVIAKSGVPAVVYVPPMHTDVEEAPWLESRVVAVVDRLEELSRVLEGDRIHFSATPMPIDTTDLGHVDLLHVSKGIPVADEVARRVCAVLAGAGAVCVFGETSG